MNIYLFGPGRSGSTLVWNILKDIFDNVIKDHNITDVNKYNTYHKVATIRDPRDILCSRLLIRKTSTIDLPAINKEIDEMIKFGLDDLVKHYNNDILILKYEDFYNDYNIIYDKLENSFDISITNNKRQIMNNKYCISNLKQISDSLGDFYPINKNNVDRNTYIHGSHISKNLGKCGNWINVIPTKYHTYINNRLHKYITFFNYDPYLNIE